MKTTNRGHYEHVYGADFETDSDGSKAWVVQWSVSDGSKERHGADLSGFKQILIEIMRRHANGGAVIYFHNLKYDVQFLRRFLFEFCDSEQCVLKPLIRLKHPIMIGIESTECSMFCGRVTLRDSMLKMPGDLRDMARAVGMEKLESPRGAFDYGWSRDLDLSEGSKDWQYVDNDARIVAVAMRRLHKMGRGKATVSGDAWQSAKDSLKKGKYQVNLKWQSLFPRLDPDLDMFLRRGYIGGLNISQHQGLTVASPDLSIVHEDVHSMYPTVMLYDPLPVGLPSFVTTWPEDYIDCWIGHFNLKLHLKEGMRPWLQFKNGLDNELEGWPHGTLIEDTREWHEMILTNVDLATIEQWYDIEHNPAWESGFWIFHSRTGVFKDYIEHWFDEKEKQPKGSIEYVSAKLMLNSLYGRFALAPETEKDRLIWNGDLGDYDFSSEPTLNEDNDAYLPYAMFITAYARFRLLENALAVGPDRVIHCDTDSVIHLGEPSESVEHGDSLGSWGIEARPLAIYEGGFKRYVEILHEPIRTHKDLSVACAGVPQKVNADGVPVGMWVEILDDPSIIAQTGNRLGRADYRIRSPWLRTMYIENGLNPDCVNTYKLIPVKVPGGVILEEREHLLNDNMIYRLRRG